MEILKIVPFIFFTWKDLLKTHLYLNSGNRSRFIYLYPEKSISKLLSGLAVSIMGSQCLWLHLLVTDAQLFIPPTPYLTVYSFNYSLLCL